MTTKTGTKENTLKTDGNLMIETPENEKRVSIPDLETDRVEIGSDPETHRNLEDEALVDPDRMNEEENPLSITVMTTLRLSLRFTSHQLTEKQVKMI
jgi:hypothetical protein